MANRKKTKLKTDERENDEPVDDETDVALLDDDDDDVDRPDHACDVCWNRRQGIGEERTRSARSVALVCDSCGHTWSMPTLKFEQAKQKFTPIKGQDDE